MLQRVGVDATRSLVKNVPMQLERPGPVKTLIAANVGLWAIYQFGSGPLRVRWSKDHMMQSDSGIQSALLYHFFHKDVVSMGFNTAVLATVGTTIARTKGNSAFLRVAGIGALTGSVFALSSAYNNQASSAAGGSAISGSLITYAAFAMPKALGAMPFLPFGSWVPAMLAYSLYCGDYSMLGGVSAGYLAFLLAL